MELSVKERGRLEKTGGNAFPFTPTQDRHQLTQGMTLRDYFAVKAMQALVTASKGRTFDMADESYKISDAMLKARGE